MQQVVSDETADYADYTDFEIYARPTYDLKQEVLWHRDKVAILYHESFCRDMIGVVNILILSTTACQGAIYYWKRSSVAKVEFYKKLQFVLIPFGVLVIYVWSKVC